MVAVAIILPNEIGDTGRGVTNIELEAKRESFDLCLGQFTR